MKNTEKTGEKLFIGIDVHKNNWKVNIRTQEMNFKTFAQPASAVALRSYLDKDFPGASYYSAYEAGFCGFSVHRQLLKQGINNIVVNPADIPTTDKDKKHKTDVRDCRKIAQGLSSGQLEAIHVPTQQQGQQRSLVRLKKQFTNDRTRVKNRIKMYLYAQGIEIPAELNNSSYWSKGFITFLQAIEFTHQAARYVMDTHIQSYLQIDASIKDILKQIRQMAQSDTYKKQVELLTSIPGISEVSAMVLLVELPDIDRFKSAGSLFSYCGVIPTVHQSDETIRIGGITNRANRHVRSTLIESAWVMVQHDKNMLMYFSRLSRRMKKNKAIVRVAKRLAGIIRALLIDQTVYDTDFARKKQDQLINY